MICLRKRGGVVMSEDVHRRGKTIDEIKEGDSLTVTESISDRDLLLYLGIIILYIFNMIMQEILSIKSQSFHQYYLQVLLQVQFLKFYRDQVVM